MVESWFLVKKVQFFPFFDSNNIPMKSFYDKTGQPSAIESHKSRLKYKSKSILKQRSSSLDTLDVQEYTRISQVAEPWKGGGD